MGERAAKARAHGRGAAPAPGLVARVREKRVCVCLGAGGVGKTTASSALALALARAGRRVALVTIDPARTLAVALASDRAGGRAADVPGALEPAPLSASARGELWTMTLDVRGTFDRLVAELVPDEERRAQLLSNRVYRELSAAVAGSHEIAAVLELFALHRDARFDTIVLDTPPSRNAVDFLDAPARLASFLESRAIAMFLAAAGVGDGGRAAAASRGAGRMLAQGLASRVLGGGTWLLLALFARATGVEVVNELAGFFRLLAELSGALRARARAVDGLLRDPSSTFLIVTSPEPLAMREARFLHARLHELELPYGGLVVNRVHGADVPQAGERALAAAAALAEGLDARLARRVRESVRELRALAARDRESVAALEQGLSGPAATLLPETAFDVGERAGLEALARRLLG